MTPVIDGFEIRRLKKQFRVNAQSLVCNHLIQSLLKNKVRKIEMISWQRSTGKKSFGKKD